MEHAMYKRSDMKGNLIVGVYVDDLIVIGSNIDEISRFKQQMQGELEMSDLGLLTYYLGLEVKQSKKGISIKQGGYAEKLLKEARMWEANPNKFPLDPGLRLKKEESGKIIDATKYRRLVGCLKYLTHTRPDLSYSIRIVSKFMDCPKEVHFQAVKQILRYLRGTMNYGIQYTKTGGSKLCVYNDSSYAADSNDGKSTTGMVFYYRGGPLAWCSKKQRVVALSSCEAKFMAATTTTCEAEWLRGVLEFINHDRRKD